MAIEVCYGGTEEFNALCYGQKNPGTMQYLERQVENISNTLTSAGQAWFADSQQLWDRFNGSDALRLARAAVRKAGSLFQDDAIRSLWKIGEIQNAPLTMQRWIMAEPTVRKMYQEQRCDGYSGTYLDMYPGTIGESNYDYRRVMQGMVTIDGEGQEKTMFYLDELAVGDRELYLDEKIDIINSWEIVASLMKYGQDDVTSVFNSKL